MAEPGESPQRPTSTALGMERDKLLRSADELASQQTGNKPRLLDRLARLIRGGVNKVNPKTPAQVAMEKEQDLHGPPETGIFLGKKSGQIGTKTALGIGAVVGAVAGVASVITGSHPPDSIDKFPTPITGTPQEGTQPELKGIPPGLQEIYMGTRVAEAAPTEHAIGTAIAGRTPYPTFTAVETTSPKESKKIMEAIQTNTAAEPTSTPTPSDTSDTSDTIK